MALQSVCCFQGYGHLSMLTITLKGYIDPMFWDIEDFVSCRLLFLFLTRMFIPFRVKPEEQGNNTVFY